jgi:pilus assembly protein Flp/PilA
MKKMFLAFLKDEGGQTSTEYILLVAVVAMIILKFKTTLSNKLETLTNSVFDKMDSTLNESSQ